MWHSAVSARDPVFYRWHRHIEDLLEKYKDTRLGPYTRTDFPLSGGLKVLEVKTIMDKSQVQTENDVVNTLVTYEEETTSGAYKFKYNKINHKDFKYQIMMSNPQKISKKVIVRLWLALGSLINSQFLQIASLLRKICHYFSDTPDFIKFFKL